MASFDILGEYKIMFDGEDSLEGVTFKCEQGGHCCGSRTLRSLIAEDLKVLGSRYQDLTDVVVPQIRNNVLSLALPMDAKGYCTFHSENLCTIYEHRPICCQVYPLKVQSRYKDGQVMTVLGLHTKCPGVGKGSELLFKPDELRKNILYGVNHSLRVMEIAEGLDGEPITWGDFLERLQYDPVFHDGFKNGPIIKFDDPRIPKRLMYVR